MDFSKSELGKMKRMQKKYLFIFSFIVILLGYMNQYALGDDHTIPNDVNVVDGDSGGNYSFVQPGDKLLIPQTRTTWISFQNLYGTTDGTTEEPITITNYGGKVRIDANGKWIGIDFRNCEHIRLTGSGEPGIEYGIEIYNSSNDGIFAWMGTRYIEIDHIEIHDSPHGIDTKSSYDDVSGSWVQYNTFIHHCYVHDISCEGFYIGPSASSTPPLENLEIAYNRIERAGWEGIQVSNARANVSVHHNYILDCGFSTSSESGNAKSGLIINHETTGKYYNNIIINNEGYRNENGVFIQGKGGYQFYNNVIVGSGKHGVIWFGYKDGDFFYNTIVNTGDYGIAVVSAEPGPGSIYDNIVVGARIMQISDYGNNVGKYNNIETASIEDVGFVNSVVHDYHLFSAASPAVDKGSETGFAGTDNGFVGVENEMLIFTEVPRPHDGDIDGSAKSDIGAFEYVGTPQEGIPPTITIHPVNRTVTAGQTATFTVGASGTSPLSYQWQKNGVNISGATSSSYTTPPTTVSDNGSTFRCVVSNAYGSATSNSAILTVNEGPEGIELPVVSVSASGNDGNIPENTIDNDLTTRWSAEGDGQWIRYDLGVSYLVSCVEIAFYCEDLRVARFDIEVSVDGTSWSQVYSGSSSGTTTEQELYDFTTDVTGRYVRIVGHCNTLNAWNSITEVDIYGFEEAGPDTTPPVLSTIHESNITESVATIAWTTDESATSQVEYGVSTSYGSWTTLDTTLVTSHTQPLSGLAAGTVYHYRVHSKDASGNEAVSGEYTFATNSSAPGTDYIIPDYIATVDGASVEYSSVKGGDRLLIPSSRTHPLSLKNIVGTQERPIIIINSGGKVRIDASDDPLMKSIRFENCEHIRLTGTGEPGIEYGFELYGGYNGVSGISRTTDVEIDHIEIHTTDNAGITYGRVRDGTWVIYETYIHHCYLHDIGTEGMYIGNNSTAYLEGNVAMLEGVVISHNRLERCGWDGIQLGCAGRDVEVHHNYVDDIGFNDDPNSSGDGKIGLDIERGTTGEWYNNIVINCRHIGIMLHGKGDYQIYNNIIVNTGQLTGDGRGIQWYIGNNGLIYNNTIINTDGEGIKVDPGLTGTIDDNIYDNIVAGSTISNITNNDVNKDNNIESGTIDALAFLDAANNNFHLTTDSVEAIDHGSDTNLLSFDNGFVGIEGSYLVFNEVNRSLQGIKPDIGAYEYNGMIIPVPPTITTQPVSQTVTKGQTATFTVAATGTSPLSYQWQKNGVNISGATSSSYTTPPTTVSDNGSTFRCVVSNAYGSATSNLAILTVRELPDGTELPVVSVSASSNDGNVPKNTIDNDLTTRWSAEGDGQWIKYDLGGNHVVSYLLIAFHKGNLRTARFDIEVSNDNTSWSLVYSGNSSGTTTGLELYDFTDVSARYVRIMGHCNSKNDWNSITEVDILGTSNQPPVVNITSPSNGATFTAPANITINATASDSDGSVSKVEFYRGGTTLIGTDTSSPYSWTWNNVAAGSYTLTAKATDDDGAVAASNGVTITVSSSPPSNRAPISNAGQDRSVYERNLVTLDGSGSSDPDGDTLSYSWVQTAGASVTLNNPTTVNPTFSAPAVTATTTLTFQLTVNDGKVNSSPDSVNITVIDSPSEDEPPVNQPPTVTITGPASGTTFTAPANITISASASDSDGSISKVEFYNGGTKLGEDTSSP